VTKRTKPDNIRWNRQLAIVTLALAGLSSEERPWVRNSDLVSVLREIEGFDGRRISQLLDGLDLANIAERAQDETTSNVSLGNGRWKKVRHVSWRLNPEYAVLLHKAENVLAHARAVQASRIAKEREQ
jgi:hypothetical protein